MCLGDQFLTSFTNLMTSASAGDAEPTGKMVRNNSQREK